MSWGLRFMAVLYSQFANSARTIYRHYFRSLCLLDDLDLWLLPFGNWETPLLCGQPLMLHLLSPAGRPVQITQDLDGFWERSYPAVKKELMGRYPRHYLPDNPRAAKPTAQAKKKRT